MGERKEGEGEHGRREGDGAGWMRLRMKTDSGAKYWTHLSLWFQTCLNPANLTLPCKRSQSIME